MPVHVLAEPSTKSQGAEVDLVLIHDLLPAPDVAFRSNTYSIFRGLEDQLDYRALRCRILAYEYDAETLLTPGGGNEYVFLSQATELHHELVSERQGETEENRPIVFLCHGFGGLLVQMALSFTSPSAQDEERTRSIRRSTYALLFAGCPHHGISQDALDRLYEGTSKSPTQLVLDTLIGSDMLQDLSLAFKPLIKKIRIINFWEKVQLRNGIASFPIVAEHSAAPFEYSSERSGIYATHANLINFHKSIHSGTKVVLGSLISCIRESFQLKLRAGSVSHDRNRATTPDPDSERHGHDIWQNVISGQRVHLGDVYHSYTVSVDQNSHAGAEVAGILHGQIADGEGRLSSVKNIYRVGKSSSTQFTGRHLQSEMLENNLSLPTAPESEGKHRIAVIHGIGGSGKTQFCLKYAETHRSSYWGVFWIDASTDKTAEDDYAAIGIEAGKGATFIAGKFWLSTCTEPWLLIIDNADDPEMDVSRLFPTGACGHILVTTRNPNVTVHATAGSIRFRGMDPEDAVDLLLRSAYPKNLTKQAEPNNRGLAALIAVEMGYLAIALDQAGTSIRRHIYTLERYLHSYLGYRYRLVRTQSQMPVSEANVIATWEIPFQRIEQRQDSVHQDAVVLIHCFAFLHFDGVPENIFRAIWTASQGYNHKIPEFLQIDLKDPELGRSRLREAINILCDYSLIEYDVNRSVCSLHPVIHRWARARLIDETKRLYWMNCVAELLRRCISPHLESSGQSFRRSLLPHIDSCVAFLRSDKSGSKLKPETADQLEGFALLYAENGKWRQAIELQDEVASTRQQLLGRYHEDTLRVRRALSCSHWNLFHVEEALKIQQSLVWCRRWQRQGLGEWSPFFLPNHVKYCIALDDLTQSLWLAGERLWARWMGERAVNGLLKRLGPDDPLTLNAMFNLARVYHHIGAFDKSHALLLTVLRKRRLFFGSDHPDTLAVRNQLGISLCARKRYLCAAERLLTNVVTARKDVLGEEHAYTLWSINDLSKILCEREKPQEAVSLLKSIIPIVQRTLGPKHVGMNMTKGNLARAYVKSQDWGKAGQLLDEMLTVVQEGHPDWLETMQGHVFVCIQLRQTAKAEQAFAEMSAGLSRKGSPLDPAQEKIMMRLEAQLSVLKSE